MICKLLHKDANVYTHLNACQKEEENVKKYKEELTTTDGEFLGRKHHIIFQLSLRVKFSSVALNLTGFYIKDMSCLWNGPCDIPLFHSLYAGRMLRNKTMQTIKRKEEEDFEMTKTWT